MSTHERTRSQGISFPTGQLDIVREQDVTSDQEHFINHWNQHYFGQVSVAQGLKRAPVHWRLIWRDEKTLLSHVALTELGIELNGHPMRAGAVGGLFTPPHLQGRGYANALMKEAETFLFERLKLPMGILFCLPELVPFYAKRHWTAVAQPVKLEQTTGSVTWSASVMILLPDRTQTAQSVIHVPLPSVPE